MHLFAPEIGMMGTSGIVGPVHSAGHRGGYSFKLLRNRQGGRGVLRRRRREQRRVPRRAEHGEHLEAPGAVRLREQPICDGGAVSRILPAIRTSLLAPLAYGMPGVQVDGNDVVAVTNAAGEAVLRARSGGGPTLIECKTYRTRPHSEGMGDYTYRSREDVDGLAGPLSDQAIPRRFIKKRSRDRTGVECDRRRGSNRDCGSHAGGRECPVACGFRGLGSRLCRASDRPWAGTGSKCGSRTRNHVRSRHSGSA